MGDTVHEEVKLSDIKPNPFRRLDLYPLNKMKIERLRSSIKRTDFWDNVVARKKDGYYELAYGHHRIESARQELGSTAKVRLILRELGDETMLKMMAADNDDAYNLTTAFILETVLAAKGFVSNRLERRHRRQNHVSRGPRSRVRPITVLIHEAIGWPIQRIEMALTELAAIDRGELSRTAIETLPSGNAAKVFHRQVEKAKKEGNPISKQTQVAIAKKAAKQIKDAPTRVIEEEVKARIQPRREGPLRSIEYEQFLRETARTGHNFARQLSTVLEFKEDFTSEIYSTKLETSYLRSVCRLVSQKLDDIEKEINRASEGEGT